MAALNIKAISSSETGWRWNCKRLSIFAKSSVLIPAFITARHTLMRRCQRSKNTWAGIKNAAYRDRTYSLFHKLGFLSTGRLTVLSLFQLLCMEAWRDWKVQQLVDNYLRLPISIVTRHYRSDVRQWDMADCLESGYLTKRGGPLCYCLDHMVRMCSFRSMLCMRWDAAEFHTCVA